MTEPIRVELHCHSDWSKDSNLGLEQIIAACRASRVDVIALTDHNQVAGAQRLQAMAPEGLTVIVGEEIATAEGDLIGLFLQERIEPRLPIGETIRRIRAQGGLVIVPHPFDRLRHEAMGGAVLDQIRDQVDFVETFNARCVFAADNEQAAAYVSRHNLRACVGCDAHWAGEHGNAVCTMPAYDGTAADFAAKLAGAGSETRPAGAMVHAGTAVVKRWKKLRGWKPAA